MASSSTAAQIRQIDEDIRHAIDARARALAHRRRQLAAALQKKINQLQQRRAALIQQLPVPGQSRKFGSKVQTPQKESGSSKKKRRIFSGRLRDRLKRDEPRRGLFRGILSLRRRADRPPVGVRDPYAGVEPNQKNATTLSAFYYSRSKKRLITRAAKAYYLMRLEQVRPYLPNKTGPGKLIEAAKMQRRLGERARQRRDYAASTRFASQAAALEQQARSMEIQGGSASSAQPLDETMMDVPPGEVEESKVSEDTSENASMETSEETPWYRMPLVWVGAAAVGVVALLAASGGKKGASKGGGKSFTSKSYSYSTKPSRSKSPATTFRSTTS